MPQALSSVNLLWTVGIPHDSIERTEQRGNVFQYITLTLYFSAL